MESPISLTIEDAVKASGIKRTKLYELFKEGKLHPRKSGRQTLIMFDELNAYVRALPSEIDGENGKHARAARAISRRISPLLTPEFDEA